MRKTSVPPNIRFARRVALYEASLEPWNDDDFEMVDQRDGESLVTELFADHLSPVRVDARKVA